MANKNPDITKLKPINTLTKEEQRIVTSKGGKASAKKRKQQKTFKELFNQFASEQLNNDELKDRMREYGLTDEDMTNKSAMMFSMFIEALKGNTKAFEIVRDTMGEQIATQFEITQPPVINIQRPKDDKSSS